MTEEKDESSKDMEKGVQPLDGLLTCLKIKNTDLVRLSTEQLTHKIVTKGRKGRRLTMNGKMKILNALNLVQSEQKFSLKDIFNY